MPRSLRLAGLVPLVVYLGLAACGGADIVPATPYQEYNAEGTPEHPAGGYLETRIAPDTYLVTFRGTVTTPEDRVIAFAYRRAGELCGGEDRYVVLKDENASQSAEEITLDPSWHQGSTNTFVWPRRRLTVRCKARVPAARPAIEPVPGTSI